MKYNVGIDLGGTNIAVGVVDENYNIVARAKAKTNAPRAAELIADDIKIVVENAVANAGLTMDDIQWIGLGSPGIVNQDTGKIDFANNLKFIHTPIKKLIEERVNKSTFIENDANCAVYGEALAGAAKGVKNVVGITLGTGVGGGIIIDGKIYCGSNYAGAELGHTVIAYNGKQCPCGRKGCLEAYTSATGLINMTKDYLNAHKDCKIWDMIEGSLDKVSGRTAFDAMRAGIEGGKEIVDEYLGYLGCGVVNIINTFQPDILFIGGGISKEGENILKPLREYIDANSYTRYSEKQTKLCTAELGNDAGIIGAAFLGNLYA